MTSTNFNTSFICSVSTTFDCIDWSHTHTDTHLLLECKCIYTVCCIGFSTISDKCPLTSGVSSGTQSRVLVPYTAHALFHSLCSIHLLFLTFSFCLCTQSCLFLLPFSPFARCDIALIEQKHVERSDISRGIRGKAGSLCDWQPVFGARGLLGMNVVSVTPDPASCWRGSWPRGVQQNAFVNLIPGSLWTVSREKAGSSDLWNAELFIPMLWKQRWAWN